MTPASPPAGYCPPFREIEVVALAAFLLPLLIDLFGFVAPQAVIVNKA